MVNITSCSQKGFTQKKWGKSVPELHVCLNIDLKMVTLKLICPEFI